MQLALAGVAHNPQTRKAGIEVEPGDTHDVVVVPEQRTTLIVPIRVERPLAGRDQILSPAVARRLCQCAVQVRHCISTESCRVRIGRAAAAARQALNRNPARSMDSSSGHDDWQQAGEAILPAQFDLSSTIDLDCWARNMTV